MIVDNLHVVSVAFSPHKTDTPLVVDTDAMLPFAVSFQWMKSIAPRHAQIHQTFGSVQHQQFSSRRLSNIHKLWDILVVEKSSRVGTIKRLDHT
jgi:hypothetical protein